MRESLKRKYVKSVSADSYVKDLINSKLSFQVRRASECRQCMNQSQDALVVHKNISAVL